MPIRPENRARYPANWANIRMAILIRACGTCEGSPAYPECQAINGEACEAMPRCDDCLDLYCQVHLVDGLCPDCKREPSP